MCDTRWRCVAAPRAPFYVQLDGITLEAFSARVPHARAKKGQSCAKFMTQFRSEGVPTMRTGLGGKIPHGRDESFFQNGRDWKCTVRGVGGVSGVNGVRLLRRLVHSSLYFPCNTAE